MTRTATPKERDEKRMVELLKLGATKTDVWRYYSDRADKFAEQLWTIGTWMLGIIAAVLALPFVAKFIVIDPADLIKFESRALTYVVCIFGMLLCGYGYTVLTDTREHVERNWERADLVRTGEWQKADWGGQKLRGWWIMMMFGGCSMLAFFGLALLAIFW
jgi:hypothetical protein